MLAEIGVGSIADIFADQIPADLRLNHPLELPAPLSEMELEAEMTRLASQNVGAGKRVCLLGGGAYDHFVPAVVDTIASRSEYYTSYTPYQAEASQGTLQTFFEYQTLVCQLFGMEVANASLYEGGTSIAEAVFMAQRVTNRTKRVAVLGSVHPEYREVLRTYLHQLGAEVVTIPTPQGTVDLNRVRETLDDQTACLVLQQPNFFGCLEQARELVEITHQVGALAVVSCEPLSLGLLQRPGDYGADIVVAEGQGLGIPLQYGGPYLGMIACREEFVRKLPGRLIGETTDRLGNRCFVLNLQAREQHIRRDKATSNICTNQGLLALRATVYMALLGPQGLKQVAELSCRKAHYLAGELQKIPGVELVFTRPFFKEFAIRIPGGAAKAMEKAQAAGFDIGPELQRFSLAEATPRPEVAEGLLIAVTEKRTKAELDRLVAALAQA